MQNSEKLLDILSATGTDNVEQTRAATTTRTALYSNVCFILLNGVRCHIDSTFSTFLLLRSWLASKQGNSIKATLTPTNTIIWRFVRLAKSCDTQDDIISQGTVPVPAFTKPVLLVGRENMNRAVHGDVVVVEVFDESEWKAPTDEVVDQEGASFTITVLSFSSPDDCF